MPLIFSDERKIKLTYVPGATLFEYVDQPSNATSKQTSQSDLFVNQLPVPDVEFEIGEEKIETACSYKF